jgi:ParB-like chromosome segregation protein Spo0J
MMCTTELEHDVSGQIRPWPADRVERWLIEKLIPYENNLRVHSEVDLEKVAASICKWGATMPPLVDGRGELICGHRRAGAAAKLGLPEVPVIVARGSSACVRPVQY